MSSGFRAIWFALAVACAGGSLGASPDTALALNDLEQKILHSRRMIRSARFEVERERWTDQRQAHEKQRLLTWMDVSDGRIREERWSESQREVFSFGRAWFTSFSVEHPTPSSTDLKQWSGVSMTPIAKVDHPGERRALFNPYVLMFTPASSDTNYHYALDFLVNGKDRSDLSQRVTAGPGQRRITVSCRFPGAAGLLVGEYDVDPAKGYGIVRIEFKLPGTSGGVAESAMVSEAELTEWSPGIWFPSIVHTRHFARGRPILDETLRIQLTRVNEQFPDAVFELAGMEVPPGVRVVRRSSGGSIENLIWTGSALRPMTERDWIERTTEEPKKADNSPLRRGLLWSSLACALLAFAGWSARYARRRALARRV